MGLAHWHDLPERYGKWKSVHKRFGRWADKGVWERVFAALVEDPDNDYVMLDTTLVRAHQEAAGGKRGARDQALGRSRGGLTTKVHLLVDARGRPLKVMITPGQQGDITTAPDLLEGIPARCVLADKAYDSNALRALIKAKRAKAVIPSNRTRKKLIRHDRTAYKLRNQVERCINRLKHFRRIATRCDRRASRFLAFIHLACATQWMT